MKLSEAEIEKLLSDLSGKDMEERIKAERFYNENKAEILPQFAEYVETGNKALKVSHRRRKSHACLTFAFAFAFCAVLNDLQTPRLRFVSFALLFGGLTGLFAILRDMCRQEKFPISYAMALNLIREMNDPRYVGDMLDIIKEGNFYAVELVEPIFYDQLRLLNHTDSILLNEKQRRQLRNLLVMHGTRMNGNFNGSKALAILKAWDKIGDIREYVALNEVAMNGGSDVVREAAEECLIHIKVRREMMEPQKNLLRASENTGGQDELLRAANSTSDAQTETLLRMPKE